MLHGLSRGMSKRLIVLVMIKVSNNLPWYYQWGQLNNSEEIGKLETEDYFILTLFTLFLDWNVVFYHELSF